MAKQSLREFCRPGLYAPGGQKQLVVVAGNAGGVMVAVNNGQAEPLGVLGVAKEVVFKANELKPSAKPNNEG